MMLIGLSVGESYYQEQAHSIYRFVRGVYDTEGKTEELKCLRASQPLGIGSAVGYIRKFFGKSSDEQKSLLKDPIFMSLYQASFIGFQYSCFNCIAVCPIGEK